MTKNHLLSMLMLVLTKPFKKARTIIICTKSLSIVVTLIIMFTSCNSAETKLGDRKTSGFNDLNEVNNTRKENGQRPIKEEELLVGL